MVEKIVIIDDDGAVLESMAVLLECHGYETSSYTSAEDYLAHFPDGAICLVVDHRMPGMNGLDLIEHLRARADLTPALIVTAHPDPVIVQRAQRMGIKLLEKPIAVELFVLSIKEACAGR